MRKFFQHLGVLAHDEFEHIVAEFSATITRLEDLVLRKQQEAKDHLTTAVDANVAAAFAQGHADKAYAVMQKLKTLLS